MSDLFQSHLDHDLKAITNALATYLTWSLQNSVTKHHDTAPHHDQYPNSQQALMLEQPILELNQDQCHGIGHDIPHRQATEGDVIQQKIVDSNVKMRTVIEEDCPERDHPE